MHKIKQSNARGFTLVEVLIVIAVLGILAAIAIPAYRGYITTSKVSAAKSTLEQFPVLIESYRAENGNMCALCNTNGTPHTYWYTEGPDGVENTASANKITDIYPDFRAKGVTGGVSLYDYKIEFTVAGCPAACDESAIATSLAQTTLGAPPGDIIGNSYQ